MDEKVKKYLDEVIEVSRRHGLVLVPEDPQGGFEVRQFEWGHAELIVYAYAANLEKN